MPQHHTISTAKRAAGREQLLHGGVAIMQPARYPIGFWVSENYLNDIEGRVAEWIDLGFTLAMSPHFGDSPNELAKVRRLLDLSHEHGIQLILCDRRAEVPGGNWMNPTEPMHLPGGYREKAQAAVRDFGDHPAVWGFYVTDEPLQGNLPAVADACRILRELTDKEPYVNLIPDHVIYGVLPHEVTAVSNQTGFTHFNEYLDHYLQVTGNRMLCYDCYSQGYEDWGGRDQYFKNLAEYQAAAVRHGVPFWIITLAMGHWMYKAPTVNEMRWQFNTALAYGAQGILYFLYRGGGDFGYGAPVDELGQHGPLYPQLRRQHTHFQRAWEKWFRHLTPTLTSHFPDAPAGTYVFDGAGIVKKIHYDMGDAPLVIGEFVDKTGSPYVMLVNNDTEQHVWVSAECRGTHAYLVTEDGEQRVSTASEGGVILKYGILPGQGYLFRIE
ncbi:MAG: hypothetical protein ACYDBB_17245 [Armatimonadota bacterium]